MPRAIALLARLALALTLGWAAVAKLRDQPGTARGFRALGLPMPYRLALAVPIVEALVAAALLMVPALGATAALTLLAVFSTLVAVWLRQDRSVTCACFGSGGSPLSWRHLARNALLGGLCVVALLG